jgi:2-polyprenyl-6-methoxyphenol hydroxylase-like FAD-dependent oxidoreductase
VVIAGAGPTGLMLAGELALAGVDVAIVERRVDGELEGTRSRGLHARTIEVLDQRGIADRFLTEGRAMQVQAYAMIPLDISDFPTRHNYGLALWQKDFERILGAWVDELGVPVHRGRAVTDVTQDDSGVDVALSDCSSVRADYLVGCDGGRSLVRKAAGIDFPGWDPTRSTLIAEVQVREQLPPGIHLDAVGIHALSTMEDGTTVQVVTVEPQPVSGDDPTLSDLSRALDAAFGTDFGVHDPTRISRFTDMTRQAAAYRSGRILLAGDAAHVHYPVGGQGLNIGVQDAVNLGWKLAQVVEGTSPESLLDTYHAERHPVAARVLQNTMAQTALQRSDPRIDALRAAVTDLLRLDEPRRRFAGMISGLDVLYDLGEGHPLLGRRMPDLDLVTSEGPVRVFTLLQAARPVLIDLGGADPNEAAAARGEPAPQPQPQPLASGWAERVQLVDAAFTGPWQLPVLGEVPAPPAVLVRPDGHVAWVGDVSDPGLPETLRTWFGPVA